MNLPILMYHKVDELPPSATHPGNYVSPRAFDEQLALLSKLRYQTITFEDWLGYRDGKCRVPERSFIITFDDGYRSTHDIAWPILRRWNFSATVFLVANLIGKTNEWDADEIQEPLMDSDEILEMRAAGIEFGSHTETHPGLTKIPLSAAATEITRSKDTLQRLLNRPVTTFCYPYAKQNQTVQSVVRDAGYRAAVIGRGGVNTKRTNAYALRRVKIDTTTTIRSLRARLAFGRLPR